MKEKKRRKEGCEGGRGGGQERGDGGRERVGRWKKKNTTASSELVLLLSPLPIVCWQRSTWRYAFHFKTHLGLQLWKQLAGANLSRLSILCDNGGQVLE